MNCFDFINSINTTKKNLLKEDPLSEKEYTPFIVNRSLSYFADTIFFANEMNKYASIPKDWQYSFYLYSVKPKKRFSKWHKKEKASVDIQLLMKEYNYSSAKAIEALELLTEEQLKLIREKHSIGGR
jgi:hypothetical protein